MVGFSRLGKAEGGRGLSRAQPVSEGVREAHRVTEHSGRWAPASGRIEGALTLPTPSSAQSCSPLLSPMLSLPRFPTLDRGIRHPDAKPFVACLLLSDPVIRPYPLGPDLVSAARTSSRAPWQLVPSLVPRACYLPGSNVLSYSWS